MEFPKNYITITSSLCNHIINTAGQGIIEPNPEFEITKISELADISNWCHHVPYVLPQGRTVWWNPVQKAEDEFEEEEEEEEEREQPDEPEPEIGPPLLTSASEDERKREHMDVSYNILILEYNNYNSYS